MKQTQNKQIPEKETRDYDRIWIKGHYKNTNKIGKNGHPIRKWHKGYWRKIKIKSFWDRW